MTLFMPTATDYADPFGDEEPDLWTTIDHDTGEIVDEETALANLDTAYAELAQVRTVRDALDLSNKAAAIAYYLKRSGVELEVQNKAAVVRLFSKYKAAVLQKEMPDPRGGDRKSEEYKNQKDQGDPFDNTSTLADLGITKREATELRALAELDEEELQEYIEGITDKHKEVTVSGAVKCGNKKKSERKRAAAEEQAQSAPVKPIITYASWRDWLPLQPQCDALITDPPYSTDVDDIATFAREWLPVALAKVKPTGRAYVCIGAYPDELRAYLNAPTAHMQLQQVLVWEYRNATVRQPTHDYILNWQAVLYFQGPDAPPLDAPDTKEQFAVQCISAPDARDNFDDHRYHAWQKPEELAERLVRHSTKPGDLILDCFNGTGTFVLAAARLGRVGRGCDVDRAMLALAKQRGCEVQDA